MEYGKHYIWGQVVGAVAWIVATTVYYAPVFSRDDINGWENVGAFVPSAMYGLMWALGLGGLVYYVVDVGIKKYKDV